MYRFIFVFIVYVQVYFCVHFYVQVDSCTPCLWTGFSLFSLFMYKFMYRFIPLLIVYVQVDSFTHCLCTGLSLNSLFMYRLIPLLIVYVQVRLSLNSLFMYRLIPLLIVYVQVYPWTYCLWSLNSLFMYRLILVLTVINWIIFLLFIHRMISVCIVYEQVDPCTHFLCYVQVDSWVRKSIFNETLEFPFWGLYVCVYFDLKKLENQTGKIRKPNKILFLNKNIGIYKTAKPDSGIRVSHTGFHYDTLS